MKKLQASVGKNGVVCVLADWSACNVRSGASSAVSWLEQVVETVLSTPGWRFVTPSQAFEEGQLLKGLFSQDPHGVEDLGGYTSELLGNSMQRKAFDELYSAPPMSQCDTVTWRRLQAVDHFRNMSTCGAQDSLVGGIRKLFESPYDAFITYMNVSRSVRHEASSAVHSRASTQK
jgi:alpha-amylase